MGDYKSSLCLGGCGSVFGSSHCAKVRRRGGCGPHGVRWWWRLGIAFSWWRFPALCIFILIVAYLYIWLVSD